MVYYLLVCHSLTYAQRTAAVLDRAGIRGQIYRTPKAISPEGCSHCVKIAQRNLSDALVVLNRMRLTPKRIYITSGDGSYREVSL